MVVVVVVVVVVVTVQLLTDGTLAKLSAPILCQKQDPHNHVLNLL